MLLVYALDLDSHIIFTLSTKWARLSRDFFIKTEDSPTDDPGFCWGVVPACTLSMEATPIREAYKWSQI